MGFVKKIRRRIRKLGRIVLGKGGTNALSRALQESAALFDPAWYRRAHGIDVAGPMDVIRHYRELGWRMGLDPNPLFDTNWYVANYYRLLKRADLDPITHFVDAGVRLDCRPNPFFDARAYAERVPQSELGLLGPLAHYLEKGAREHVHVGALFDSRWYQAAHLAADAWPAPALAHYLRVGAYRGLAPGPGVVELDGIHAMPWYRREVQRQYTRMISSAGPAEVQGSGRLTPHQLDRDGKGRIAVYTAIVGDYDNLKLPYLEWTDRVDFFCFTDRKFRDCGGWRLVMPDYHSVDPTRIARFYKTHPHVFFRNYDAAIWIDGNIGFRVHPAELVDGHDSSYDVVSFRHPLRQTIYEEVMECIARSKDEAETMLAQVKRYTEAGYVQKSPLIETNVMIFRPSRPQVAKFLDRWWGEIDRGTRRDQLSINYCVDSTPGLRFGYLPEQSARDSRRFLIVKHG